MGLQHTPSASFPKFNQYLMVPTALACSASPHGRYMVKQEVCILIPLRLLTKYSVTKI